MYTVLVGFHKGPVFLRFKYVAQEEESSQALRPGARTGLRYLGLKISSPIFN